MRYEAEHRLFEHVFSLTQRLVPGRSLGRAKSDFGESHRKAALRLVFEECGINMRHLTSREILRAQAELAQSRPQRASW